MANNIAYIQNFTNVLDRVYKKAAVSTCLNSPRRMVRAGAHAKEIKIPKIAVPGLGVVEQMPLSGSNVLYFELEDGTSFIVRPSGTEPKIKIYILAQGADKADVEAKVEKYAAFAETLKR